MFGESSGEKLVNCSNEEVFKCVGGKSRGLVWV